MKLPRMSKPPFLRPHHLQKDDLLEITAEPYIQTEEENKYGRQRGYAVVRLVRTGETFTWGLNSTSWDRLHNAFGEDSALWRGKKVKVQLENMNVRGETRQVIYGAPYVEPQKNLAA